MVQVRIVNQQIQQAATPNADIGVRATAESFGAGLGRGIADLAGSLDKINDDRVREQIREGLRADEAAINGAMTRFSDAQVGLLQGDGEEDSGYLGTFMEDALKKRKTTLDGFDAKHQEIRAELTPRQQQEFDKRALRERVGFNSQVQSHVNRNAKAVENRNLDTVVDAAHKKAVIYRGEPNAVISELGNIARAEQNYGLINGITPEEVDRRIKLRAGALWSDVIGQSMANNELETAGKYLDALMVTDTIDPIALEKMQREYDNRVFVRDTTQEVGEIVRTQTLNEDFTQASLDVEIEKGIEKYGEDPKKLDLYNRTLKASWADANGAKRKRDGESMGTYLDFLDDEGTTYAGALNEANKMPEHLREQAIRTADGKFGKAQEADITKDPFQQQVLKEGAIDAIRSGEIESMGEVVSLLGDKMSASTFNEIAKWFDPQAQMKEKEFDGALTSVLQELDPLLGGGEAMREAKAAVREHVQKVLGTAAPEPERIKKIIQAFKMEFTDVEVPTKPETGFIDRGAALYLDAVAYLPRKIGLTSFPALLEAGSESLRAEVDPTTTPAQIAERLGQIQPVIPEGEVESVRASMRKDGLDPAEDDEVEYYRTVVLGLPRTGENSFSQEARRKSEGFISAQRKSNLHAASIELANQTIRNRIGDARYRGPDGVAEATGRNAMTLELRDQSDRGLTPDWMREYLMQGPNVVDAKGKEITSFQLYIRKLTSLPEGRRAEFIQIEGTKILEASRQ